MVIIMIVIMFIFMEEGCNCCKLLTRGDVGTSEEAIPMVLARTARDGDSVSERGDTFCTMCKGVEGLRGI